PFAIPLTQHLFVELAYRGARDLLDEGEGVGQLPLREVLGQVLAQLRGGDACSLPDDDVRQWALLPLLVRDADDGGLEHGLVPPERVLQVDRGDPLPAGLDDVLRAVGQGDVPEAVAVADVAGPQPAVVELRLRLGIARVGVPGGHPRTPDLELADRFPVARQDGAVVPDDAALDAAEQPTGGALVAPRVIALGPERDVRHRGHR